MNDDELWAAIDTQRLRTADLLEGLAPAEWDHASLCDGWTVRDVAAHLTLQQMALGAGLRALLRHPGARSRARLPTNRLIADIRGMVGSRRHNVGVTHQETLIDIAVHGQDIALPLGRTLDVPAKVAATAASRVWSYRTSPKGRMKARVFRTVPYDRHQLTATDASWSEGEGPEIRRPILAILLLLTGRPAGLSQLTGEGAAALAAKLGLTHP
jgi:uncharacterized protein (TIGR03083 family)